MKMRKEKVVNDKKIVISKKKGITLVLVSIGLLCIFFFFHLSQEQKTTSVEDVALQDEVPKEIEEVEEDELEVEDTAYDALSMNEYSQFKILNHEEYITPILGNYGYLMVKELYIYVKQNEIDILEASCIGVKANESTTDFYFEFSTGENLIVTATYNSLEQTVNIEKSEYDKEEILGEVWYYENVPEIRDVEE